MGGAALLLLGCFESYSVPFDGSAAFLSDGGPVGSDGGPSVTRDGGPRERDSGPVGPGRSDGGPPLGSDGGPIALDGGPPGGGTRAWSTPGVHEWVVPPGVRVVAVSLVGGGGGGVRAAPWGNHRGGRGTVLEFRHPARAGQRWTFILGGGGRGASCGGGTSGAGGGGLTALLIDGDLVAAAGGGGGASEGADGCSRPGACPTSTARRARPGMGFGGGGERSDRTAAHGEPGRWRPRYTGGTLRRDGCGGDQGFGGFGGGGAGGGTHNGFGGGGGGGGLTGGGGGVAGGGGDAGRSGYAGDADVEVRQSLSAGPGSLEDGADGEVGIRW